MDKIIDYINNKMKKHNIETDFKLTINDLVARNVITNNMSGKIAYSSFLLHKSRNNLMFKAILERNHIFDITLLVENDFLQNLKSELESKISNRDGQNQKKNTENDLKKTNNDCSIVSEDTINIKSENLKKKLEKTFNEKHKYIHVEKRDKCHFIGIRLNNNAYEPIKNVNLMPTLLPYYLLYNFFGSLKKINFQEKIYLIDNKKDVKHAFENVIAELKGTYGMVMVSTYEIQFCETNICNWYDVPVYLKNLKWPKNIVESKLFGEMALSELFAKSKYKCVLENNNAVLKHGNVCFKLLPFIEKNIKNKIIEAVESLCKKEGENFWRKVRMIKYIFAVVGAYPIHINDLMVDSLSLCLGKNICGDGKFIEKFLEFYVDMKSILLDIDKKIIMRDSSIEKSLMRIISGDITYSIKVPCDEDVAEIVKKINLINKRDEKIFVNENSDWENITKLIKIEEKDNLVFNLSKKQIVEDIFCDCDFILSKNKLDGFHEINYREDEFFCKQDKLNLPILGTYDLENTVLKKFNDKMIILFSPCNECLYVKVDTGVNFDFDLALNTIISETNFNYIKLKQDIFDF